MIELRDVRPGKTRSFEEVKPELAKEFGTTERDRVYAEKAGRLTDLTYQDPSSLESAAKELGLTVQKTDLFSRNGGTGIAANPSVLKAAFSDSVLVQNNNSDPIEIGPNHILIVRIAERKPATPKRIDEVRDEVKAKIVAERAAKKAKARADELYAALGKGETLEQIASANKLKLESQQGIGRDAANLDSALVGRVRAAASAAEQAAVSARRRSAAIPTRCCSSTASPTAIRPSSTRRPSRPRGNTLAQERRAAHASCATRRSSSSTSALRCAATKVQRSGAPNAPPFFCRKAIGAQRPVMPSVL